MNKGADRWTFDIGPNVFPADSKKKSTWIHWVPWQKNPIPLELHEQWKRDGDFSKGLAVVPGRIHQRIDKMGLYLASIEWDKLLGFTELFMTDGKARSVEQVGREHYIEQHLDDLEKGHPWIYTPIVFPKKNAYTVLGLEVKGLGEHGIVMSSPSFHKNDYPYQAVGILEPVIYSEDHAIDLLLRIDRICRKHDIKYLSRDGNGSRGGSLSTKIKTMLKNLEIDYTLEMHDGQRHQAMIAIANSLLFRHSRVRSHEWLKEFFLCINRELCRPVSLPEREALKIWNDAVEYVAKVQQAEQHQHAAMESNSNKDGLPWLPDNVNLVNDV